MPTRIPIAVVGFLLLALLSLRAVSPQAVVPRQTGRLLQDLEAQVGGDPTDARAVTRLAHSYIALRQPAVAIALIRSVPARTLEDPAVSDALARAYEAADRLPDALATSALALARCARAMGTSDVLHISRAPTARCTESTLAALERHHTALSHLNRWGVQSIRDPRVPLAYRVAERRVSLAAYASP